MKKLVLLIALITQWVTAQTIQGTFSQAKEKEIVLKCYDGFTEKELSKTRTDSLGKFSVIYPETYVGVALMQIDNTKSVIVLLNKENFEMQWENLQDFNSLKFINSKENDLFATGITINQEVEQKLVGLKYLLPLYKNDNVNQNWYQNEINIQEQMFEKFIENLPKDSYVKDYLIYRKFIADMQLTQERYKELARVNQHQKSFEKLDFSNQALWNSGLLKEIFICYYQVLELYQDKEIIIKKSIDANSIWLKALANNSLRLQEIAEFCFTLLEKKNLTQASEHIALAMLNKNNCQLTDKQVNLFEQYRKLAIGKTAPNIVLNQNNLNNLNNKYKLVVFGASWCPNCQTDYPSLIGKYKKLKETFDLEVVYISLDTDKKAFAEYYKEAPFKTFFDGKGWETQAAKDYHVFATPTYILLDKNLNILAKINSPEHLEAWLQSKG